MPRDRRARRHELFSRGRRPHVDRARWYSSDIAGLFFLIAELARRDWPRRAATALNDGASATRCVAAFLAGLGLAVLGRFDPMPDRLDPLLALFAGFGDNPDIGAYRRFFASADNAQRQALLTELCAADAAPVTMADSWEATSTTTCPNATP